MPEYAVWSSPECPLVVEYSAQVFEEIRRKAVDGLVALRRTGLGVGGLLLGERVGNKLRVHAFEEIECSHAMGPSFLLTAGEFATLRDRLSEQTPLSVLGLYISKPRGELDLSAQQKAIVAELFHSPEQVVLVLRPGSLEPCRSAFYFHDGDVLTQAPEWELHPWKGENLTSAQSAADDDLPAYPIATAMRVGSVAPKPELTVQKNEPRVQKSEPLVQKNEPASQGFVPVPITVKLKPSEPAPMVVPPEPVAAPERVGFAPEPIRVKFDEVELPPRISGFAKFQALVDEKVFLPMRRNSKKLLIWTVATLFLIAAGYGVYASRPLWVTPPPANLTATDNNGLLTFKWNPESAEFVDAGTLSILDDGRNKTIALTHDELMRGRLQYNRNSARVSASLALDERRFIYQFEAPGPLKAAPVSNPAQNPASR